MHMTVATFTLHRTSATIYTYLGPALLMPGTWRLRFTLELTSEKPVTLSVTDLVGG
jgi:hypothetical protein